MTVSIAIMAHPQRMTYAAQLAYDLEAPVIVDVNNDEWDTGSRSLEAYDKGCSHHLVIQDDAVPSPDLLPALERIASPEPVCLYVGRPQPHHNLVRRLTGLCEESGLPWFTTAGPWWGVALLIPTAMIDEAVKWCHVNKATKRYDIALERYFRKAGIRWRYTHPSLVQHQSLPSILPGHNNMNRVAWKFHEESALEIDWSLPVLEPPEEGYVPEGRSFRCWWCGYLIGNEGRAAQHVSRCRVRLT